MDKYLPSVPKVKPILLVYPSVYQRLTSVAIKENGLDRLMQKCCELSSNRPTNPADRRDGYGFSASNDALFVVWSQEEDEPDIFILSGPGEGFGPGHTCPTDEELQMGIYGDLIPVPFLS